MEASLLEAMHVILVMVPVLDWNIGLQTPFQCMYLSILGQLLQNLRISSTSWSNQHRMGSYISASFNL